MPSSHLKEKIREAVRAKLRERSKKDRKEVEGRVNIEGVTRPKHRNPKEKAPENESKRPAPANVSIGAHGGRYVQEASGHKRYLKEGTLAGRSKVSKSSLGGTPSVESMVKEIAMEDEARKFLTKFKSRRKT